MKIRNLLIPCLLVLLAASTPVWGESTKIARKLPLNFIVQPCTSGDGFMEIRFHVAVFDKKDQPARGQYMQIDINGGWGNNSSWGSNSLQLSKKKGQPWPWRGTLRMSPDYYNERLGGRLWEIRVSIPGRATKTAMQEKALLPSTEVPSCEELLFK